MIDAIVAKIKPTRAMSTARPENRLCEKGVVNVQPAIVIVKSGPFAKAGNSALKSEGSTSKTSTPVGRAFMCCSASSLVSCALMS
jgi:hypothetical protein